MYEKARCHEFAGGRLSAKVIKSSRNIQSKVAPTDHILALGKPKTSIDGHPHAVILAGEKYNYLIETSFRNQNLNDLLHHVDSKHIFIGTVRTSRQKDSSYIAHINMTHSAPLNKASGKETAIMQTAFHCPPMRPDNTPQYECRFALGRKIQPIAKPEQQVLQHRFRSL